MAFFVETLVEQFDPRRPGTGFVENNIPGGKTGQDLDAKVFGDLAHPFRELADGDGIIPVMDHLAKAEMKYPGELHGEEDIKRHLPAQQKHDIVLVNSTGKHVFGDVTVLPSRDRRIQQRMQRLGLQHRTGEIVVAQVGGLFHNAHVEIRLGHFELYRGGQTRRPRPHD